MRDSGLRVDCRGLVRTLLLHPTWAPMRHTEDEVIAGEVSVPRGLGGKDHLCVYWNHWEIRWERSENKPGAKILEKWGRIARMQGIRWFKLMPGDLKLGLYSRAKVNYITPPPLAKLVSQKADTFRIWYYLMSQSLYFTIFFLKCAEENHTYVSWSKTRNVYVFENWKVSSDNTFWVQCEMLFSFRVFHSACVLEYGRETTEKNKIWF